MYDHILPAGDRTGLNLPHAHLALVEILNQGEDQDLERRIGVDGRCGNLFQYGIEERRNVRAGLIDVERRGAFDRCRVDDREIELLVRGAEMDKQVEGPIHHVIDDRIRPVDLVDDDDGLVAERQGFSQHEGRLRHGALFRVDQDEDAVHHAQSPFDFTAEVGVARRIDDIDLYALVNHAGVLGTDCDPALTFLVHRVHDPFAHIVDLAMDMGLSEYGVDQCRFAMVDVGDDRDVSNIAPALFGFELGCHGRFCCGCLIHRYCCMLQKKDAQKPRRRTAVYPKHDVRYKRCRGKMRGWRASTGKNSSFEGPYLRSGYPAHWNVQV